MNRPFVNGHDTNPPLRSQTPPHTQSRPTPRVEAILLDEIVEEPSVRAEAFDSLIGDADPRAFLRALARSRIPELKAESSGFIRGVFTFLFGGRRRSVAKQLRTLMRDLSTANKDAARFIDSTSKVEQARLRTGSTQLNVAAEQEKVRARIARYQRIRAQHEAAAKSAAAPPPSRSQTSPPDVVGRADLDAAIRLLVRSNRKAIDSVLAPVKTALDQYRQAFDRTVEGAIAALGDVTARVAALESWTHTASESQQVILAGLQDRASETAALAEKLDALRSPGVLSACKREQELAEAEHQIELARKRAEITAHQATARRHRERPKTPMEEFALRAREQLRTATSKRRTVDKIRSDIESRLSQTAERYGEDSEAYKLEREMYDDLTTGLEELK